MSMDLFWIGRELGPSPIVWSSDQSMRYALGVGAGVDGAFFETKNQHGESLIERGVFVLAKSRG